MDNFFKDNKGYSRIVNFYVEAESVLINNLTVISAKMTSNLKVEVYLVP